MREIINIIQSQKVFFDAVQAINSVVSLAVWCIGSVLLFVAWRRNAIRRVSVGPLGFDIDKEKATDAAVAAARDWQAKEGGKAVDVKEVKAAVAKAFEPDVAEQLIGRSVLWVDDNPQNNELVARALRRLRLDVVQLASTEQGLEAMQRRHFDLIISDMGRGDNMRAGYDFLKAVRDSGSKTPFLIFAGSQSPEYRREAEERGAQLSTNDMLELMDEIIRHLGG